MMLSEEEDTAPVACFCLSRRLTPLLWIVVLRYTLLSGFHHPELEKLLESFILNYRSLSHFNLFFISNKLLKMIYESMYMTEHE